MSGVPNFTSDGRPNPTRACPNPNLPNPKACHPIPKACLPNRHPSLQGFLVQLMSEFLGIHFGLMQDE